MNRYLKVDQSAEQLRRRTEAFRKLATMVVDGAVLKALKDLAAKLEARARAVEKSLSDETNRPEG
jgi:hypothetical protein